MPREPGNDLTLFGQLASLRAATQTRSGEAGEPAEEIGIALGSIDI